MRRRRTQKVKWNWLTFNIHILNPSPLHTKIVDEIEIVSGWNILVGPAIAVFEAIIKLVESVDFLVGREDER